MATEEYAEGYTENTDTTGRREWKMRHFLAASFLIVIVVGAAILFAVNRVGDESQDTPGNPTQGAGASLADQYEWRHKEADFFGHMVYAADDPKGQILSESTREYDSPTSTEAKDSEATDVVFQATDFSGRLPIPFSTTDGPTGFDGEVPVGYSQSAAGASLAAAAYITQMWTPPHYDEYVEKATVNPSTEVVSEAKKTAEQNRAAFEDKGDIFGFANTAYDVVTFDGDYARVNLFLRDKQDGTGKVTVDLRWIDGMWKVDRTSEMSVVDEVPQEVSVWR
jgi:hypothetical protein